MNKKCRPTGCQCQNRRRLHTRSQCSPPTSPPSFSDNDAVPAGRTVGDIGHSARNLSSERQGGELEESDEQVLREHVDLRQRCLRHFERWGQRYLWVVIVVFIGIILYATLIHFFPSFYVRQKHSTA
ncbi:hypothetical protein MRX96_044161 [Rhipicephalus microplus]